MTGREGRVSKVMTWNVEPVRAATPAGPGMPAIFKAKIEGLAETINPQTPDALALQEIGDPAARDKLVQLLQGTWRRTCPRTLMHDTSVWRGSSTGQSRTPKMFSTALLILAAFRSTMAPARLAAWDDLNDTVQRR
jgi:hypothetical protein